MLTANGVKAAIVIACAVLAGCATSRSEIRLSSPASAPASVVAPIGRTVVIRSVVDERIFAQAPRDPSTPSLGFGGADQATADTKGRAIGRKRNGFGKAMGDILLPSGQTVEGVVRENLTAALAQAGFQVKDASAAGPSPLVIDVHIKQFWAWLQPGFVAIKLNTNIATELDLAGAAAPIVISVHAEDSRQFGTEAAWMQIVDKALEDYRAQVVARSAAFSPAGE
jgi:uncharacterized lipoprotein YajG